MRYFVTLNGREFPLRLDRSATGSQVYAAAAGSPPATGTGAALVAERALSAQLLRPAQHHRPALVQVEGRTFRVLVQRVAGHSPQAAARVRVAGEELRVQLETELQRRVRPAPSAVRSTGTRVAAPMPGRVVKVSVKVGDRVQPGTPLLSVEAMKMENELQSPGAGIVVSVHVRAGATVESDQELVLITPES